MAAAVGPLDEVIKEYLVFRGFTNTLKYFDLERKEDKDKGFRVNRIVDHILQCINKSDFNSLQSFWMYLNKRFFSRMNHDSLMTVFRLETGMLRMFLVHATRQGRHDVVKEFFERMTVALHDRKEWKDWFTLPFTKNPEQHPSFKLYFSKEWSDGFVITLHNFFSTLFACLPLPALLNFEAEHQKMQALATENHHLHNQLATTRQALADAEFNVQKLEARLAQQVASQASQSAPKRTYSASGKAQKATLLGTSKASSPWKKKTAASNANTSSKKTVKTTSLDEKMEAAATNEKHEGIEKQISEPLPQKGTDTVTKHKELSLSSLTDKKDESDLDLTSPETPGVVDEGGVKSFTNMEGNAPFIPISQEIYKHHSAPITHCKFSPNAKHIATVDTDGVMRVWDPSTLSTSATVELKSSLLSLDWAPQSDNLVLIGSGDSIVKLFETTTLRDHWEVKSDPKFPKILAIACSHSSSTFAFSAAASTATAPTPHTGSHLTIGLTSPSLPSSKFTPSEMTNMKAGSGGGTLAYSRDLPPGGVFIWDLKTQRQKCTLPISPMPVGINCMAFNHNSSLLITGGTDGIIRLFDVTQQECLFGWPGHEGEVFNVQFSSDETSVYSMGRDNKFSQWSINRSGKKMTEFKIHNHACQPTEGRLRGEYFPSTPRGNLFAFESEDKYVLTCAPEEAIVYQVGNEGLLVKTLSIGGQCGPVTCVDWLQGRRSYSTCVTASMDGSIRVTNLLRS